MAVSFTGERASCGLETARPIKRAPKSWRIEVELLLVNRSLAHGDSLFDYRTNAFGLIDV